MPNGRPVDQPNFWFASEKVQNKYMSNWSPTMTDKQLAFSWVAAGGLESFATMEKAAKKNANDVRLGEWRKMQQVGGKLGSGMYATKPKDGTSASRYASYESYKYIVRYWRDIEKAAANHGIKDVNALAAVLMYESHWQANQRFGAEDGDNLSSWTQGEGASIGVGQLEIYKIRHALNAYKKGFAAKNYSNGEIAEMMKNPSNAIHAAAAYMRYLKERIKGLNRPMTDMDAAIAYCTCSGVVVDPKTGVVSAKRYVAWANSGYIGRPEATKQNPENGRIAEERRNALLGYVKAAPELFACGRAACWTYM
jgi:hypothetical protein